MAGSLLQHLQWPLLTVAVRCYLRENRVAIVQPDELWLHLKQDAEHAGELDAVALSSARFYALPDDPHAAHPDATVAPNRAALCERLRETITAHFAPAVALLCTELGCKERPLWLFVADGLAGTLAWTQLEQAHPASRVAIEAELDGLVRAPRSPLFARQIGLFELTFRDQPRLHYDRATCCYWYKTEDARGDCCATCPRRPKAERDALLLNHLAEQEATKTSAVEEVVPS